MISHKKIFSHSIVVAMLLPTFALAEEPSWLDEVENEVSKGETSENSGGEEASWLPEDNGNEEPVWSPDGGESEALNDEPAWNPDSDDSEDDSINNEEFEDEKFSYSGILKNETSMLTGDGDNHEAGDLLKSESSLNLFLNYNFTDTTKFHMQGNLIYDSEAIDGYDSHRINSQHDYLREFYIDSILGGWEVRAGKQQVVWGTADGVKFLDIINPTDYREWGQNTMEDSRIPLWLVKAEKAFGSDGMSTLQLIWVPDLETNQIPGLNDPQTGDNGQPFVSKGAETITGRYNGFYNIARDMGQTSSIFQNLLSMGGMKGLTGPMKYRTVDFFTSLNTDRGQMTFSDVGGAMQGAYNTIQSGNVQVGDSLSGTGFTADSITECFGLNENSLQPVNMDLVNTVFLPMANMYGNGDNMLNAAANSGSAMFTNFQSYMGVLQSAYMGGKDISFTQTGATAVDAGTGTLSNEQIGSALNSLGAMMYQQVAMGMNLNPFDPASQQAVAEGLGLDMTSETFQQDFASKIQEVAMPEMAKVFKDGSTNQFDGTLSVDNPTSAFDYMGNTAFGTFKYFQGMGIKYKKDYRSEKLKNSNVGFRWKSTIGTGTNYSLNYYSHWDNNPFVDIHWEDKNGKRLTTNFVTHNAVPMQNPTTGKFEATPNADGSAQKVTALESMHYADGSNFDPTQNGSANLVFSEKMDRVQSMGGSFDTTFDTPLAPVVMRGEFLYETGVRTPVVDKLKLSYGDLVGAMKTEETDFFKGVIGLDVTVLTNLFVSLQYMQVTNLDYVDETKTYNGKEYRRYTANPATMSLSNSMKEAEEHQIMYTLYLSKPFLEGDTMRVNNLFLYENDGGAIWNRFDLEYTATDSLILLGEYNYYGNDENGIFGQFEDQSSIQLGLKYLF